MPDRTTIADVEILRPGTFCDNAGREVVISAADLIELAGSYDPGLRQAPVVIGHPKTDDLAWGWMTNLRVDSQSGAPILLANLDDVDPGFADLLEKKRLKYCSLSFWPRQMIGNPTPGRLYAKHLGFLGAKPPAVHGLKPVALADDGDAVTISLSSPDDMSPYFFTSLLRVLGRWRDHLVATLGIEKAGSIIDQYDLESLRDEVSAYKAAQASQIPQFSAQKDAYGVTMPNSDLAAREAALAAKEADLKTRQEALDAQLTQLAAGKKAARDADDAVFVDSLVAEARLPAGERDYVLAELAAMDDQTVIQLSDGGVALTPRQAYMNRLRKIPAMVQTGEMDAGGPVAQAPVAFAAPPGYEVVNGDLHARVIAYQAAHPGTDYSTALRAVF